MSNYNNVKRDRLRMLSFTLIPLYTHLIFAGNVELTPHFGNQLGGAPIIVSGNNVTFREYDDMTCIFGDKRVDGVYINEEQVLCVSPGLPQTGIILFQLVVLRNETFFFRGEANYNSCKSLNKKPIVFIISSPQCHTREHLKLLLRVKILFFKVEL